MKKIEKMKKIGVFLIVFIFFIGCVKPEKLNKESVFIKENIKKTELDYWIDKNYTKPYGIAVKYQGDAVSKYTNVYPPKKEKVLPVLKALKTLWINLYNDPKVGGKNFIANTPPININLYGGKNTGSGREEIATPGSALTIHIYNVDSFDEKNDKAVFKLLRIVYHNYAKRLIESKPFNREEWRKITLHHFYHGWQKEFGNIYTPFFKPAYFFGFYSLMARKNIEDDFAETISVILTHTDKEIEEVIKISKKNEGPGVAYFDNLARTAHVSIINKRKFVTKYFNENWQINLKRMQSMSITKRNNYLKKKK